MYARQIQIISYHMMQNLYISITKPDLHTSSWGFGVLGFWGFGVFISYPHFLMVC